MNIIRGSKREEMYALVTRRKYLEWQGVCSDDVDTIGDGQESVIARL